MPLKSMGLGFVTVTLHRPHLPAEGVAAICWNILQWTILRDLKKKLFAYFQLNRVRMKLKYGTFHSSGKSDEQILHFLYSTFKSFRKMTAK